MRQTLKDFFKALRSAELDISIAESLDAMNAVLLVGLDNRAAFKNALSLTLAKTVEDKAVFDTCFEQFFSITPFSEQESSFERNGPKDDASESELAEMLLNNDREALAFSMHKAAKQVDITNIWFFTQKARYINRILREMGVDDLNAEIARTGTESGSPSSSRGDALQRGRDYLREEVRDYVEKQLLLYGQAATTELNEGYLKGLKLSNIEQRDFRVMKGIIRKMAKRLSALHARKRKIKDRGVLDFRQTMRKNLAYDGLLIETFWKKKTADKPRVMAICDVSRSVRPYARFLLLFLYSLNEVIADIKSYTFVDRFIEVTRLFEEYPAEQAIEKIIKEIGFGMTDYGQVLRDIKKDYLDKIDNKTTLIILGDARNNNGNPETRIMKQIHDRSKRVIWLNPEPKTFWGIGDSEMKNYLPYCSQAKECNTIKDLEYMVSNLLSATR